MIRNIVFDYGGVIVNVYDEQIKKAFADLRVSRLKQLLHPRLIGRLMDDYIDGLRPTTEVVDEIFGLCGEGVTRERLESVLSLLDGELPAARLETIIALRKKYKVYLLSNISEPLWQGAVRQIRKSGHSVEDCFDATFLSYELRIAKPDSAIYRKVIEETRLIPQETLYLDDRRNNVEAGRQQGLQASLVTSNHLEDNSDFMRLVAACQ